MRTQRHATSRRAPGAGALGALLRVYAIERAGFVTATVKAKEFLKGKGYGQSVPAMNRNSTEASEMVQALSKNQLSRVQSLLQSGFAANTLLTNEQNVEHVSLLSFARSALAVRLLLDAGANPNAQPDVVMSNPLSVLIKSLPIRDRVEAVDIMLQAGADPNGGTGLGARPLDNAVAQPDIGVMMLLIDAGAQVDRFAVLSALQSHNERAHRVAKDLWQVQQNVERTRQVVDLLVYASAEKDLQRILADKEVARLLKMTPDVAQLFIERISPASAELKSPAPSFA